MITEHNKFRISFICAMDLQNIRAFRYYNALF